VGLLAGFGRELRAAGLAVGSGDIVAYCTAMAALDPSDLPDLYWAGRTVLVTKREDIPAYDSVFTRFFLGEAGDLVRDLPRLRAALAGQNPAAVLDVPAAERVGGEHGEQALLGLMASDAQVLRHRSFAACTPDELAAVRRIMARLRLTPPRRRTRRTAPARRPRDHTAPDLRRMVRQSMRTHGELAEFYWRHRKVRLRPLILILDISGSMADYSRNLLHFAYSARRAAPSTGRVEVFCFGTRLTRVTRELDHRRLDHALDRAARAVVDWEGGTRIGESLQAFLDDWGRRGLARGGVVVICSDGLERGDPAVLAAAMERLARLSHRIVWLNPHAPPSRAALGRRGAGMAPPGSLGMMVAAPHVDLLLPGHDLASLERFAALLPTLN